MTLHLKNDELSFIEDSFFDLEQRRFIKEIAWKMNKQFLDTKLVALHFASKILPFGEGVHLGGTFPMRKEPSNFETDQGGRLKHFNNVFVTDSSVFPTVPAGPIALSGAANAWRIAKLS